MKWVFCRKLQKQSALSTDTMYRTPLTFLHRKVPLRTLKISWAIIFNLSIVIFCTVKTKGRYSIFRGGNEWKGLSAYSIFKEVSSSHESFSTCRCIYCGLSPICSLQTWRNANWVWRAYVLFITSLLQTWNKYSQKY